MAINKLALDAYQSALQQGFSQRSAASKVGGASATSFSKTLAGEKAGGAAAPDFGASIGDALEKVNSMEKEKASAVEAFASGERENVHELMITLQKAGIMMNMTTAVRGKVMDAYRELSRLTF